MRSIQAYAIDQLTEEIVDKLDGFNSIEDVISAVEDAEPMFDGDSFCPYYNQQIDVIDGYEREFGADAEDICDSGQTFKASEWQQAQTAYAYAVGYCAFSSYLATAKDEIIEALREFGDDVTREFETDDVRVRITNDCPHGWAAHNRELADGTMIWESQQLDGCNGMAREINGPWVSCCINPADSEVR